MWFPKYKKITNAVYQLVTIKSLFLILLAQRSWFFTGQQWYFFYIISRGFAQIKKV